MTGIISKFVPLFDIYFKNFLIPNIFRPSCRRRFRNTTLSSLEVPPPGGASRILSDMYNNHFHLVNIAHRGLCSILLPGETRIYPLNEQCHAGSEQFHVG
jgi:hypothetical protein